MVWAELDDPLCEAALAFSSALFFLNWAILIFLSTFILSSSLRVDKLIRLNSSNSASISGAMELVIGEGAEGRTGSLTETVVVLPTVVSSFGLEFTIGG